MTIVLAILQLLLWLLVIPFLVGGLCNFMLPEIRRTIGITFILGDLAYLYDNRSSYTAAAAVAAGDALFGGGTL